MEKYKMAVFFGLFTELYFIIRESQYFRLIGLWNSNSHVTTTTTTTVKILNIFITLKKFTYFPFVINFLTHLTSGNPWLDLSGFSRVLSKWSPTQYIWVWLLNTEQMLPRFTYVTACFSFFLLQNSILLYGFISKLVFSSPVHEHLEFS